MKRKALILGLVFIVVLSASYLMSSDPLELLTRGGPEEFTVPLGGFAGGPGGCSSEQECAEFCQQNPEECQQWCDENPSKCPEEHLQGFGSGFGEGFTGPGGCTGPDCEQICQQNPEVCQQWCRDNPEICKNLLGGSGFGSGEVVDPPNTVITFAKTVNFNAEQFTEEDIIKAKQLGANMITLWPARIINDNEILFFPQIGNLPNMINIAHQNGLQVELRSSFGSPDVVNNYEKFKANAIAHVAEYAKFAEERKIYRIVPFGEVDNHMVNHCDKITELSQELLQEMRKHYSGQIGTGVIAPWRDCGFTFEGYDYLTFSPYAQTQIGMDKWLTPNPDVPYILENNNLVLITKWVREVADRSGVSTIHVGETGVINPEDDRSSDFDTIVVSKGKEAEFFEKMFLQIGEKVDGVSVFYNSKTNFMTINGDPAEEVIKKWYSSKLGAS